MSDLQRIADIGLIEQAVEEHGKADTHLVGVDGNALSLIAHTRTQLRRQCQWPQEALAAFQRVALSGDYNNVILTCCSVIQDPMKGVEEYEAWERIQGGNQ
jgi:hypothetical protein